MPPGRPVCIYDAGTFFFRDAENERADAPSQKLVSYSLEAALFNVVKTKSNLTDIREEPSEKLAHAKKLSY